jgi:hypothetical protein
LITLKATQEQQEAYNYLRAQWRKKDKERRKFIDENPGQHYPYEGSWDELRIAWAVTKGDIRMIKYNFKVLAIMRAISDTLFLLHDMYIEGLQTTLKIAKSEEGYFTRAIYEMEDQGLVTIKRDPHHDVPVPGSQLFNYGVSYVPGHGVPKLVCGQCVIEGKAQ